MGNLTKKALKRTLYYVILLVAFGGCSNTPPRSKLMANLQGAWEGHAVPDNTLFGRTLSNDKYADSLLLYYYPDSTTRDLKLRFKDSTCWIDGLNFYHRRVFSIVDFDVVNEHKNLLTLETTSNKQDSLLLTKLLSDVQTGHVPDTFYLENGDSSNTPFIITSEYDWSFGYGSAQNSFIQSPKQVLLFQDIQLDGDKMTFLVHNQHSNASTKVEFTRVK